MDSDSKGENRLKWLRGDSSNEGTGANFRVRTNSFKLGDIVDPRRSMSAPRPPCPTWKLPRIPSSGTAYVSRREMVYAGANDGMLHGFDAATGNEKIAYVPSMVFPNLSKLTDPSYAHRYYVNASPTVGDAYGTFHERQRRLHHRLLAHGAGRRPGRRRQGNLRARHHRSRWQRHHPRYPPPCSRSTKTNAAKIALWEIHRPAPTPQTWVTFTASRRSSKVHTDTNTTAWAVIFGNGYNSANENAALYVVNAVTGR